MEDSKRLHILLIDENLTDLFLIHSALCLLTASGTTSAVTNTGDAITHLENEAAPDLIILGPRVKPVEREFLTGKLLLDDRVRKIPVIELAETDGGQISLEELISKNIFPLDNKQF